MMRVNLDLLKNRTIRELGGASQAWSTAAGPRPAPAGVRGFEFHPPQMLRNL